MPRSGKVGTTDAWQQELDIEWPTPPPKKKLRMDPENDGFSKRSFLCCPGVFFTSEWSHDGINLCWGNDRWAGKPGDLLVLDARNLSMITVSQFFRWCLYQLTFRMSFPDMYFALRNLTMVGSFQKIRSGFQSKNKNWWLSRPSPQMQNGDKWFATATMGWYEMGAWFLEDGWIHSWIEWLN